VGTIDTIQGVRDTSGIIEGKPVYWRRLMAAAVRIVDWLERQLERRRSRRALLELTDEQLADIGISRSDAYREGIRSFLD